MSKSISDVRDHLFNLLDKLGDDKYIVDPDRTKAIVQVSQTIINSAKVEVDYLKAVGGATESGFLATSNKRLPPPAAHKIQPVAMSVAPTALPVTHGDEDQDNNDADDSQEAQRARAISESGVHQPTRAAGGWPDFNRPAAQVKGLVGVRRHVMRG